MTEEEIRARLTLDADDYVREMEKAEKKTKDFEKETKDAGKSFERSMEGMKGKIGELVKATADGTGRIGEAVTALAKLDLALGMVGRIKDFAAKIYDTSMAMARLADDAADTEAYLKRTFGSMSNEAKQWASETAKAYGAYSQEVQSFYTRLYETLTASGLAKRMADEYAQELTRLRYDLSAVLKWYSEDQISQWITDVATKGNEEAFQKLMAGMTFEEAAKSAGVWSASMDQATKKATMARLLMAEYSDEVGSWTANLNTASGAEQRLSASIDELQKNIGQVLSPVLAAAINMVSDLVDTFNGLAEAIGRITGASVIEVTSADLVKEVARSMGQLADATEEASEASAGLAGFDRLNRLADKSGEGEGKGMDFADGLDSWMRLWELDASAAETAADALWDAILDSGLKTEDQIRDRFGDLFGWMAEQSDVELSVRTEAVEGAWDELEKRIRQYIRAVRAAKKEGMEDTSSIRQTYGTAIQAIFPKLADRLGVYSGKGMATASTSTAEELQRSMDDVVKAIQDIPVYSDLTFRAKVKSWLSSNAGKVEGAVDELPVGSDISAILAAFERAGIDVTDASAVAAAGELATIGKAYQGSDTLGSIVAGLGGVEAAVGSVSVPEYSDAGLRSDLDRWLKDNAGRVTGAIGGLPKGADISSILTAFEAAGIDVSDPNAQSAAGYLQTIGKAYNGSATLGSIVSGLGGVAAAVGKIPQYDDTKLYQDAQGWINSNWASIRGVLNGIPSGTSLSAILDTFKAEGFDVNDPAVATGIASLATSIDQMPAPRVTNVNNVDTDPIEQAMKDAVKGLEVKSQTSVTVQERDYSSVFDQMGKDIGGGLSGIGDAVGGIDIPDYTSIIDQIKTDVGEIKGDMSTVADNSTARTVPDAEKAVQDARDKASQDISEITDKFSDVSTWLNPVDFAGALVDASTKAVEDLAGIGQAEEALREAQNQAAEQGLPDIATAMLAKLGNTDNREKLREALMAGKDWYNLNPLYRRNAQVAGITQSEWASAVSTVKAMQTPAPTASQSQAASSSYYARQGALGSDDVYGSIVARYDENGQPWSALPQYVRDWYAKFGIQGYASGGVFEPNSPVLAVLGDNRTEREVAAPYSTIVKAVKDALSEATLTGSQRVELTTTVQLDGRTVARTTLPYLIQETKRLGVSL